jgi:hypothetical protein
MWSRFLTARKIRLLERALARGIGLRKDLENRLRSERLRLLGPNALAVDPARLFHGSALRPARNQRRRFS